MFSNTCGCGCEQNNECLDTMDCTLMGGAFVPALALFVTLTFGAVTLTFAPALAFFAPVAVNFALTAGALSQSA